MKDRCRICGNVLDNNPLLILKNMPNRAQNFLSKEEVKEDSCIDLLVFQCNGCGLLQLNIEPVEYYRNVIRATRVSEEIKKYKFKEFNDFINKYNLKNKKIIEIGSGSGEFLEIMKLTGVEAYGLENLEESVKKANKNQLKVYQGFIDSKKYVIENSPYDAFYCMNFLEHIPNPNEFLSGINNNLKEEGIGLIEVPNVNMVLENSMFSEFISDHLMYFTKETLKHLVEQNGFEVIECNEVWHDYVISIVVKKRKKLSLNSFNNKIISISREINKYIDGKINNGYKVAVWGAGHQALAIISLVDISKKIEFIIDSAEFKQGKYTPGSHVRVVSPEILKKEKIDVILVIAASYSDEVANIIKKNYQETHIAILRSNGLEIIR